MSGSEFRDHFSGAAAAYATFRPHYPPALFAWLAELAPSRSLAWDCATGTGQAAVALAPHFARVVATDASSAQIAHAEPHAGVEYAVQPAEASGLADRSVDLVTVAQALHWFDRGPFFAEVRRVLVPGGIVAAWTYAQVGVGDPVLDAALARFERETVGPYWPPERKLVDTGYRTIPFPFEELTPPSFRMEANRTLAELLGYLRTWSAVLRYAAARRVDPVEALERELAPRWGDPGRRRTISWPLAMRVGVAFP